MRHEEENKGRVLRVKTGYNPNSSSVGSQIPTFFAFAAASGACAVIALHILNAIGRHIWKKKGDLSPNNQK